MIICEICNCEVKKVANGIFPTIWIRGKSHEVCNDCHEAIAEEIAKIYEKALKEWPKRGNGVLYIKTT